MSWINPVHITALKAGLMLSLVVALAASGWLERRQKRHWIGAIIVTIGLGGIAGYTQFGQLRASPPDDATIVVRDKAPANRADVDAMVHKHEQYHFYFGSTYLEEVRYFDLYRLTLLAATEDTNVTTTGKVRRLRNFRKEPVTKAIKRAQRARQRFSAARWTAFKADLQRFHRATGFNYLRGMQDHGNTASPAWALFAAPITGALGAGPDALVAYASLDLALLALLFAVITRTFGLRSAAIALGIGLSAPHVFSFVGGSILRLDWLFACGLAMCALRARHFRTAGALLGYAVASKVFCGLIALALGIRFVLVAWDRRRPQREHVALVGAALISAAVFIALSSLAFGGPDIWVSYWRRILVSLHEGVYGANHSLRDVFFQLRDGPWLHLPWTPDLVAVRQQGVDVGSLSWGLSAVRLAAMLAFVPVIRRHDDVFAMGIGVLFVFVLLVTNRYYWIMMTLPALAFAAHYRSDPRQLIYLCGVALGFAAEHLVWLMHDDPGRLSGYPGSVSLAALCVLIWTTELTSWARHRSELHATAPNRPTVSTEPRCPHTVVSA